MQEPYTPCPEQAPSAHVLGAQSMLTSEACVMHTHVSMSRHEAPMHNVVMTHAFARQASKQRPTQRIAQSVDFHSPRPTQQQADTASPSALADPHQTESLLSAESATWVGDALGSDH